jgi:hypothetical protein
MTEQQLSCTTERFNRHTLEAWGRLALPAESATAGAAGADPSCTSKCDQNRQANTRQVGHRQANKSTHKSTVLQEHCGPCQTEHRARQGAAWCCSLPGGIAMTAMPPQPHRHTALHKLYSHSQGETPNLQKRSNSNTKAKENASKRVQKYSCATTLPLINHRQIHRTDGTCEHVLHSPGMCGSPAYSRSKQANGTTAVWHNKTRRQHVRTQYC